MGGQCSSIGRMTTLGRTRSRCTPKAADTPRASMGQVSASSTILINADPKTVLNAVADYRDVRPKILSSNYSQYRVLEGGQGQGTVAAWAAGHQVPVARRGGQRRRRREHCHREGRQLLPGDQLDRRPGGPGSSVTVKTTWKGAGGIRGFFEKTFARWACARFRTRCWRTGRSSRQLASWSGAAGSGGRPPRP